MPEAMVSMVVAQIAPGTIGQGVRLNDDDVPLSGYPGRRAGLRLRRAAASAKAQASPQFLRAKQRTETSCAQERPMLETLAQTRRQNDVDESPAGLIAAEANISKAPHREPVESVVSALGSDAARGLTQRRSATAARAIRSEPAQERARDALVEAAARAVREFPCHHSARRHRHLGDRMAAAGPARKRAAL